MDTAGTVDGLTVEVDAAGAVDGLTVEVDAAETVGGFTANSTGRTTFLPGGSNDTGLNADDHTKDFLFGSPSGATQLCGRSNAGVELFFKGTVGAFTDGPFFVSASLSAILAADDTKLTSAARLEYLLRGSTVEGGGLGRFSAFVGVVTLMEETANEDDPTFGAPARLDASGGCDIFSLSKTTLLGSRGKPAGKLNGR